MLRCLASFFIHWKRIALVLQAKLVRQFLETHIAGLTPYGRKTIFGNA